MKYIKRIRESNFDNMRFNYDIDPEYVEECFVDLIDLGYRFWVETRFWNIEIPIPNMSQFSKIEILAEESNTLNNLYQTIKLCIDKVKVNREDLIHYIRFPDIHGLEGKIVVKVVLIYQRKKT